MSARNYYPWKNNAQTKDTLWVVAGRFLQSTGYSNTITLAEAIRNANQQYKDWNSIPDGTPIYLPSVVLA